MACRLLPEVRIYIVVLPDHIFYYTCAVYYTAIPQILLLGCSMDDSISQIDPEEPAVKRIKLEDDTLKCFVTNDVTNKESSESNNVKPDYDYPETSMCNNEAELKVGMKLLFNKQRFSGIIKQRYSDFMVRECDNEGNLVYLTSLSNIDGGVEVVNKNKKEDCKEEVEEQLPCPIDNKEELEKIITFATEETDKTKSFTLLADNDKEHRKLVHMYIKKKFKHIETGTVTVGDSSRAIKLTFKNEKNKPKRRDQDDIKTIPKFLYFVLFKQNKDTMDCINLLSKMLHINSGNFGYAGTKDKRATTIQRISVQNTLSTRLEALNKRLINIAVGNFSYSQSNGLRLGDLSGNEFTIIIRNVVEKCAGDIEIACKSLKRHGFINYFGLQRFGTGAVSTHEVGKALLSLKFSEACDMILKPREENGENTAQREVEAQKIWMETKDPEKAFRAVKQKYSIEGKLLDGLRKRGTTNLWEAFKCIPRNTRLLYLHSYQSLIWNKAVSKRIQKYGLSPMAGDLVLSKDKDEKGYETVHTMTADDIKAHSHTIYDVVLPLPGYDMTYPSNKLYEFYKDLLANDELDIGNMRRQQKELSLSGKYRKIMIKPQNMSWESVHYEDFKVSLIENDLEKLNKQYVGEENLKSKAEDRQFTALKLQMTLPSSCYATSALRELLIADSSYQTQIELNKKSIET